MLPVAQKKLCQPKLCKSQKNMLQQKKRKYVTPKRETHVD